MTNDEHVALMNKYLKTEAKAPRRYLSIVERLPEFDCWVKSNKIKLTKNLLKATYLSLIENGKNYDLLFTQNIGRRYRPSVGEWVEHRYDQFVAIIENVPVNEIDIKYNWIMGR